MADGTSRPAVSRRREIGGASARSLLMTILGEFVLPRGAPVWTQTLVSALGMFGVEHKSARQALARTAAEGWLAAERAGRQVRWSLTPPGQRLLSQGAQRIYSFTGPAEDWDGRWLLVYARVPDSDRRARHVVRSRLSWAGFGSLGAGLWSAGLQRNHRWSAVGCRAIECSAAELRTRSGGGVTDRADASE